MNMCVWRQTPWVGIPVVYHTTDGCVQSYVMWDPIKGGLASHTTQSFGYLLIPWFYVMSCITQAANHLAYILLGCNSIPHGHVVWICIPHGTHQILYHVIWHQPWCNNCGFVLPQTTCMSYSSCGDSATTSWIRLWMYMCLLWDVCYHALVTLPFYGKLAGGVVSTQ